MAQIKYQYWSQQMENWKLQVKDISDVLIYVGFILLSWSTERLKALSYNSVVPFCLLIDAAIPAGQLGRQQVELVVWLLMALTGTKL